VPTFYGLVFQRLDFLVESLDDLGVQLSRSDLPEERLPWLAVVKFFLKFIGRVFISAPSNEYN